MELTLYIIIVSFIFGSIIGSFNNCLIYRLPNSISLLKPSSHCPKCKTPIPFRFNIPIFGWLLLKGKCFSCSDKISPIYPLTEFLNAVLAILMLWATNTINLSSSIISFDRWYLIIFSLFLIPIFIIDLRYKMIYDKITIPLIIFGVILSFLKGGIEPFDSLIGILVGGGIPLLIYFLGLFLFKKEGLGGGDLKLLAAAGAWFGPMIPVLAIFTGSIFALIVVLLSKLKSKESVFGREIPFGPFLSIGIIIAQIIVFKTNFLSFLLTSPY